jgi:Transcriptional regulator/sugar kinase
MTTTVLAADLGGTNLRMAVVSDDGTILHRVRRNTPESGDRDDIVAAITDSAIECLDAAKGVAISAMGVAVPATLAFKEGILKSSPQLPSLNGLNLSAAIGRSFDFPIVTDNDATSAAVGEHWLGATAGFENSICVTLGTGVGGGLIIRGEAFRGNSGTAGEIGHVCVERQGFPCGCGSCGCIEQYASAIGIARHFSLLKDMYRGSLLAGFERPTPLDVFDAANRSDELALEIYKRLGMYLGIALAGLVNVLNPDVIVIGGGVSAAWELFIDHTRAEIQKRAFREPAEHAKLVRAKLGDDAGILGVARLALLARK